MTMMAIKVDGDGPTDAVVVVSVRLEWPAVVVVVGSIYDTLVFGLYELSEPTDDEIVSLSQSKLVDAKGSSFVLVARNLFWHSCSIIQSAMVEILRSTRSTTTTKLSIFP